jgi:hypothetical protein
LRISPSTPVSDPAALGSITGVKAFYLERFKTGVGKVPAVG